MSVIISQSSGNNVGLVQDIPNKVLIDKAAGQRIEARVMQATRAAEVVSIKVGDSVLQLRTLVDLQAGQRIQLEWAEQAGKTVLKLLVPENQKLAANLQVGQQFAVELVKVLAQGRILVQMLAVQNGLLDIDVSHLSKQFKLGDKLVMDIISVKPLAVQLQPEMVQQKIEQRLQQLLSQQAVNPQLTHLLNALTSKVLPETMQSAITNLLQSSLDKTVVTQSNALKQAMALSGTFTENGLLNQPSSSNQDFKANVVKILAALETVMSQVRGITTDEAINKLPAQVLSALASQGKTVEQLLHVLLSAKGVVSPSAVQTLLPGLLNKEQALLLTQILSSSVSASTVAARPIPLNLAELMLVFKELEGVYNKLQLNQLLMLRETDSGTSTTVGWLFDIPIKDKQNLDLLQLHIDQHEKKGEQDDEIWSVQLRLDTQNLGPVQATVTLVDEDVKVVFRAQRSDSAQLLTEHLDELVASLSELGVTASHMSCFCGEVDEAVMTEQHYIREPTSEVDLYS